MLKKRFKLNSFLGGWFKINLFFIFLIVSHNTNYCVQDNEGEKKVNNRSGGIFNTLTSSDDYKPETTKIINAVSSNDDTFTFTFTEGKEGILFDNVNLCDPSFDEVDDFTLYKTIEE